MMGNYEKPGSESQLVFEYLFWNTGEYSAL